MNRTHPKMKMPNPRFLVGDRVTIRSAARVTASGVVIGRSYDNLLHASQWRYAIQWQDKSITDHHYDYDLRHA